MQSALRPQRAAVASKIVLVKHKKHENMLYLPILLNLILIGEDHNERFSVCSRVR